MSKRTGTTHITHQHTAITIISLILSIHATLFAQPHRSKHARNQEIDLAQSPPPSPTHKRHREHITDPAELRSLLLIAPQPFLSQHGKKILHAIDLFHDIPGFTSTLKKALNQARQSPFAHGYLYEIETALSAQEDFDDPVCSFGQEHCGTSQTGNHEIDVETRGYQIECKDIFWESRRLQTDPESIQRQLREQRAIIEEENLRARRPKTFLLCSKHHIPTEWRTWLEQQGIAYDCPDDSSQESDS